MSGADGYHDVVKLLNRYPWNVSLLQPFLSKHVTFNSADVRPPQLLQLQFRRHADGYMVPFRLMPIDDRHEVSHKLPWIKYLPSLKQCPDKLF